MTEKKLTFEQMEFIYQATLETANKALFEDHFSEHGWTQKEFTETMLWTMQALAEGKLQKWVN